MRVVMERARLGPIAVSRDRHDGPKLDAHELAGPVVIFFHHPRGVVSIVDDRYSVDGAEVQVPKHVACTEACDEQLLGIVSRSVATKAGVARAANLRLSRDSDRVIARVAARARSRRSRRGTFRNTKSASSDV